MEKVQLVPIEGNLIEFLKKIGEETKDAIIFLDEDILFKIKEEKKEFKNETGRKNLRILSWKEEGEEHTQIKILVKRLDYSKWYYAMHIWIDDIAFKSIPKDPKKAIFIQLEQ